MAQNMIRGRKGGSSGARTPTEQPDDLQSVAKTKLLIALGEGEFAGQLTAKDIYLDGTPLENADGSQNFSGVTWEFRPGTQAQTYIQGIPGTENEITVGTEVKHATAWTHTLTNTQLSAVRLRLKWSSLFKQEDNGDLVGNAVDYAVDLQTDGGAWQTALNTRVTGKTMSGYERSHRIDLPQSGSAWTVRLRKITPDVSGGKAANAMTLQSYTEVIDAKLRYPNTALLYIEFDSSQFSGNVPQVSCEPRGRVIRVPETYDPESRTYTGTWDGSFKWAWTDNPAWIFYDLVVSDRFGLGDRLTTENVDKWTLYEIAQYCDQLVPDGKGGDGTEPRYICNVYVQSRNDAWTVLRDFVAIFRGMTCWGGNQIVCLADMPRDVDYSYTRANVVDGKFTYSSSSTKSRYTSALVSYSDPDNGYADAMEPVFEADLVARYKQFNQLEVTAIGCTRQSEANRKGRWGILTNNKDRMVTFAVGLEGNIPQPGHIIAVADEMLAGKATGGRLCAVNGRTVTLDRVADVAAGDRLRLNLPSGISQSRTVSAAEGRNITVTAGYSETPEAEAVWVTESDTLYAQQYRVASVKDNNDGTLTITGTAHDPDKYDRIDTGAIIDTRPTSVIPAGHQSPPANIVIDSYAIINQGISVETMHVSWDRADSAITYEAQWRRGDGNWVNVPRGSTTSFEVTGIYTGRYRVRVRAINAAEVSSGWGYSDEKNLTGKTGKPGTPTGLRATDNVVWNIDVQWGFPEGAGDTSYTEIQRSSTGDHQNPQALATVAYPTAHYQHGPMASGVKQWYRARLVDKTGNAGDWTEWVGGESSTDASDMLSDITDDFMSKDDGQALTEQMATNPDAILQNALANYGTVTQQWAQYGKNKAGIIRAQDVAADAQKSVAKVETDVTAKFNDTDAALQQKLDAYADASGGSAIYTLKTGITYGGVNYNAGLSVAVTVNGDAVDTRVAIHADQFVMLSGDGKNTYSPFAVKNGQVIMNAAFIENGTVTNEKIGNYIQSDNYVAGSAGWHIGKDGGAELSNVTVRGHVEASSGSFSNVTIDESCTVKRLYAENIYGDLITATDAVDVVFGNKNGTDSGTRYPVATIAGAPFPRVLCFLGATTLSTVWRQNVTIRIDETVIWQRDTGNDGTSSELGNFVLRIPASGYDTTHHITLQFPDRGDDGFLSFKGVMMLYKVSGQIILP